MKRTGIIKIKNYYGVDGSIEKTKTTAKNVDEADFFETLIHHVVAFCVIKNIEIKDMKKIIENQYNKMKKNSQIYDLSKRED